MKLIYDSGLDSRDVRSCENCKSVLELEFSDYEETDTGGCSHFRVSYFQYICPVCKAENSVEYNSVFAKHPSPSP
jgi:hypothetical protein